MANYLINDTQLTSVADAIRAKSGGSAGLAFPSGFISEIGNISNGGGGGASSSADVVFYDDLANNCEGGVVYSYTAEEFAKLTEMPENPDHSDFSTHGLNIPMTSQGWNWTLANAKAHVAKYGKLNIGQMYIPTDGKSHYICYVPLEAADERWNVTINLSGDSDLNWQVDDGPINTVHNSFKATFSSVGWHDLKISATTSTATYYPYTPGGPQATTYADYIKIRQVFVGANVPQIGQNGFRGYLAATNITLPNGITSIGEYAISYLEELKCITLPINLTSVGNYFLRSSILIRNISLPYGISVIGTDAIRAAYNLDFLTIPDGVTSIGNYGLYQLNAIKTLTIPDTVTSIGDYGMYFCDKLEDITVSNVGAYGCAYLYALKSLTIKYGATTIGQYGFSNCICIRTITIPDTITNIGQYAFNGCEKLNSITLPSGNSYSLENYTFRNCYALHSITIPSSVSSIGAGVFDGCGSLTNIIMESSTPPTLTNSNAFNIGLLDYSIIVPAGSRSDYISASNWSALADHIVEATA